MIKKTHKDTYEEVLFCMQGRQQRKKLKISRVLQKKGQDWLAPHPSCSISSHLIGKFVLIPNGKSYIRRKVTKDMVSRSFGEYVSTRKKHSFGLKDKKNKKGKGSSKK